MKAISIPFRFENGRVASTTDNNKIARQRITDVLATRTYERVMRPEYGAGVSDLLFEPVDPLVFADYKIDALTAVNDNVSNAKIKDLIVRTGTSVEYNGNEESTLVVSVVYDVAGEGTSVFTVTLDSTKILTEETPI